jgi:hypothetical protein
MFFDRLFHRKPREREMVAGLRDQIIELGTHVRFLEADRLPPQPRDAAGRFVSKYEIRRKQMADACSKLTPEQREAAKARAMQGKAS